MWFLVDNFCFRSPTMIKKLFVLLIWLNILLLFGYMIYKSFWCIFFVMGTLATAFIMILKLYAFGFEVDFGDFQFLKIQPQVIRYVSGVATAVLGSGGLLILLFIFNFYIICWQQICLHYFFSLSLCPQNCLRLASCVAFGTCEITFRSV